MGNGKIQTEAKKDLARLEEIRKRREEAEKRRKEEEAGEVLYVNEKEKSFNIDDCCVISC